MRVHGGGDCVKPGCANEVTKVGQKLADLYKFKMHTFESKDGIEVQRTVIYADAEELVADVILVLYLLRSWQMVTQVLEDLCH